MNIGLFSPFHNVVVTKLDLERLRGKGGRQLVDRF
jgi:hypothetical protein